jgi:sulfite reductase alpha subunit-like flavoprotein
VVHLEVDLASSGAGYAPGDSLGLLPANDPGLVEGLLGRLGLEGEAVFAVEPAAGGGGGEGGQGAGPQGL